MSLGDANKVTINLTNRNVDLVKDHAVRTGENRTDIINQSVGFYVPIRERLDNGAKLQIINPDGTVTEILPL
jgi:hypothetical protein